MGAKDEGSLLAILSRKLRGRVPNVRPISLMSSMSSRDSTIVSVSSAPASDESTPAAGESTAQDVTLLSVAHFGVGLAKYSPTKISLLSDDSGLKPWLGQLVRRETKAVGILSSHWGLPRSCSGGSAAS